MKIKLKNIGFDAIFSKNNLEKGSSAATNWMLENNMLFCHGSGIYTILTLGLCYIKKIKHLLRNIMLENDYGEVRLPILSHQNNWKYRELDNFTLEEYVLAPTSEETIIHLQKMGKFFQFSTNFRREKRPQFGLTRTIEFVMKDAYGVFLDQEEAKKEYENTIIMYDKFFQLCDLDVIKNNAIDFGETTEYLVLTDETKTTFWEEKKAVEVGHTFLFWTDIFQKNLISFGIGVTRLFHILVELKILKGISLPEIISPFKNWIIPTSGKYLEKAKEIFLSSPDDTVLDDTEDSFGIKIQNAENILPNNITIVGENIEKRKMIHGKWEIN